MSTLQSLNTKPRLDTFLKKIKNSEDNFTSFTTQAYDLELNPSGQLSFWSNKMDRTFEITQKAEQDLARLTNIPLPYFLDCDPELRAFSFNRRLLYKIPQEHVLHFLVKDNKIDRISNSNLLHSARFPIIDRISNSMPECIGREEAKVVTHSWNGKFDISIISPTATCEPRKDDIVAFGINVRDDAKGSIQVQGAAFRLWCSNGSIQRICDNNKHRLRRPLDTPGGQQKFLDKIERLARDSWSQWQTHAEGLQKLVTIPISEDRYHELQPQLRQAPFFLSAQLANQVFQRLKLETVHHQGQASLYDLYNSMTNIGSHDSEISMIYSERLRLGSGEFIRHESRVCKACRQLLLK